MLRFGGTVSAGGAYKIPSTSFQLCTSLTSVTIPDGVTLIGTYGFYGCFSLTDLVLPDSITEIGNYAFYGCSGLTELTLPASLSAIGNRAFAECTGLKGNTLEIPATLAAAYNMSFGNRIFTTIINHSETEFSHYILLNTEEESYEFYVDADGKKVETIGNGTYTLKNLYLPFGDVALVIPTETTTIEANAFEGDTSITTVDASRCTEIGAEAFKGCTGLTRIRLSQNCEIGDGAFDGCTALIAIYGSGEGTTQTWAEENGIVFVKED